jgi:hypothetical protein
MRHDQAFAALLERELEMGPARPDRRASGTLPAHQPAAPPPFLFVERRFFFNATVYASLASPAGARQTGPSVAAPSLYRPGPPLAPPQERPLDEVVGLEASLRTDFTAAELRSAFRVLARRYHPDSHPGSSEAMKVKLSRRFADLTEHYRTLLAALEPAGAIRH